MKIGRLVQRCIPAIFDYCETRDPDEFVRIQDPRFSKATFDINYPFCRPVAKIGEADQVRFWSHEYIVQGVPVRVTNHWFNPPTSNSLTLLRRYLEQRVIVIDDSNVMTSTAGDGVPTETPLRPARGRYKGNAIGNAQNYLVRNLLSRLGEEQFSVMHWEGVVADFGKICAYCGTEAELVMDHVVPINKQALGEHRLGNLVPACRSCNATKSEQDFRDFLAHDPARIAAIEAHMEKHAYTPLGDHQKLRQIIELAHQDVRQLADRYVAIIDAVLQDDPKDEQGPLGIAPG